MLITVKSVLARLLFGKLQDSMIAMYAVCVSRLPSCTGKTMNTSHTQLAQCSLSTTATIGQNSRWDCPKSRQTRADPLQALEGEYHPNEYEKLVRTFRGRGSILHIVMVGWIVFTAIFSGPPAEAVFYRAHRIILSPFSARQPEETSSRNGGLTTHMARGHVQQ